jgi:hypothetical protein
MNVFIVSEVAIPLYSTGEDQNPSNPKNIGTRGRSFWGLLESLVMLTLSYNKLHAYTSEGGYM